MRQNRSEQPTDYKKPKKKRALETEKQSEQRRAEDRISKARLKDSENKHKQDEHTMQNTNDMANKRHLESNISVPLQPVIDSFIAKAKHGSDYVCTSCHRLMYRQTVVPLNVHKYTKTNHAILADVFDADNLYTSFDGNRWICVTCNAALTRGNMPTQAVANGLRLPQIPPEELSCLNALEMRLISMCLP